MDISIEQYRREYLVYAGLSVHKRRVEKSKRIIRDFIADHPSCYVSWSAGKDSTALMHLAISEKPDIKVMSEKDDMDFPEEMPYVLMMKERYNIDLDIISPDVKLWDVIGEYEITEDIHSRKTSFSDRFFYGLIRKYKQDTDRVGVMLGLRSEESKGRRMNFKIRGFIYEKSDGDIICQPIAEWTAKDVFGYLFASDVPIMDVYFKTKFAKSPEQIRKSWILPSAQACKGQAVWLKYYYPDIFHKLSKINPEIGRYVG